MTSLKPRSVNKAKESVSLAHQNDMSVLIDFDDPSMGFRERIMAVEKRLEALPQVEIPIEHHFGAGIYARTMVAPRGTMLTGKIYKVPQMIILSSGEITVRSEFFNGRISGPHIYNSPAGSKRFGYCHTDVVWTCLVRAESDNVPNVEQEIYAASYEELEDDNIIVVEV